MVGLTKPNNGKEIKEGDRIEGEQKKKKESGETHPINSAIRRFSFKLIRCRCNLAAAAIIETHTTNMEASTRVHGQLPYCVKNTSLLVPAVRARFKIVRWSDLLLEELRLDHAMREVHTRHAGLHV